MFIQKLKTVFGCNNTIELFKRISKIHDIGSGLCSYHVITNRYIYDVTDKIKTKTNRDNITPVTSIDLVLKNMGVVK